ncbi:MAG: DUF2752 domain-containing protein [Candidatus Azobacteroides sp.]|nr:DUF2752 domain-containing protein [Candidatus Azobacteroides sp.]
MKKIIVLCVAGLTVLILYIANPEGTLWLPKCFFFQITGLQCPACGTQRALHQLFHLHFREAFYFNPFMLLSFPYLAALVSVQWFDNTKRLRKLRAFCHHSVTIKVYLFLMMGWWIVRNLVG